MISSQDARILQARNNNSELDLELDTIEQDISVACMGEYNSIVLDTISNEAYEVLSDELGYAVVQEDENIVVSW